MFRVTLFDLVPFATIEDIPAVRQHSHTSDQRVARDAMDLGLPPQFLGASVRVRNDQQVNAGHVRHVRHADFDV